MTIILSTCIYVCSVYFANTLFKVRAFSDRWFILKVITITAASWFPLFLLKKIVDWYDPNAVIKVRKSAGK